MSDGWDKSDKSDRSDGSDGWGGSDKSDRSDKSDGSDEWDGSYALPKLTATNIAPLPGCLAVRSRRDINPFANHHYKHPYRGRGERHPDRLYLNNRMILNRFDY